MESSRPNYQLDALIINFNYTVPNINEFQLWESEIDIDRKNIYIISTQKIWIYEGRR